MMFVNLAGRLTLFSHRVRVVGVGVGVTHIQHWARGWALISSYLKSQSSDTAHLSDNQQLYFKPSRGREALVSFELNCLQQSDVFRAR